MVKTIPPGPHARRAEHSRMLTGIPRIMEGTLPEHFKPGPDDDSLMTACKQFVANARYVFETPVSREVCSTKL
jgi:hypothetical protein